MSATLGQQLLTYFAGPTLATLTSHASEIPKALDALQHTTHSAEQTAAQIREVLSNPGGGLSGQPTIPRGEFTRKLAGFYARVFPGHHVLVVYDRSARLVSLKGVLGGNGRYVAGPTEMYTCHKKVHRGRGRLGLWGFHCWVFKEGEFELLGDGGFVNWCFESPSYTRDGKSVSFHKLE